METQYEIGTILENRFEIIGQACGGMGAVLFCKDLQSKEKETVALKTYLDEYLDNDQAVSSFVREAENMLRLGATGYGLDQIVGFDGLLTLDGKPYIKMEYCPKGNLRSRLDSRNIGPEDFGLIATRILLGICFLDVQGIVHRDLKPENILFDANDDLRLADFGISKILEDRINLDLRRNDGTINQTSASGTVPYMSPEQLCGRGDIDFRSDLWAFAVIMLEMIHGHRPFIGSSIEELVLQILSEQPNGLLKIPKSYPKNLRRIIAKCLEKDRDDRYLTIREFVDDWDRIIRLPSSPAIRGIFGGDSRIDIPNHEVNTRWIGLFFPDRADPNLELLKFSIREARIFRDAHTFYYKLNRPGKAFDACAELLGSLAFEESAIKRLLSGAIKEDRYLELDASGKYVERLGREEMSTVLEIQLKSLVDLLEMETQKDLYLKYVGDLVDSILMSDLKEEPILTVIGQLLLLLNDHQRCETLARMLIDRNPQNISAWNTLAYSLKTRQETVEALKVVEDASDLNPDPESAVDNSTMASMCANLQVWEIAVYYGERSLAIDRKNSHTQYLVCISKLNLGKKVAALEHFELLKDLIPNSAEVERLGPHFEDLR